MLFLFSMSVRERDYESILKIGLHPLVCPHSRQAEQELLGRYSVLWLEEREEHQSPWCAAALLQAFSLWVHCWPARFVITQRYRTKQKQYIFVMMKEMKVWVWKEEEKKQWRKQWLEWNKPLTVGFVSLQKGTCFFSTWLELWSLFITVIHPSSSRKTLITATLKSSWHY